MQLSAARRARWSVAYVASLGAHGAVVTAALLWSLQRPITAEAADRIIEFELPAPAVTVSTPQPAPTGPPAPGRRARSPRGLKLGPAAPAPVLVEDSDLVAPAAGEV